MYFARKKEPPGIIRKRLIGKYKKGKQINIRHRNRQIHRCLERFPLMYIAKL